jgi:hypothetical protein
VQDKHHVFAVRPLLYLGTKNFAQMSCRHIGHATLFGNYDSHVVRKTGRGGE